MGEGIQMEFGLQNAHEMCVEHAKPFAIERFYMCIKTEFLEVNPHEYCKKKHKKRKVTLGFFSTFSNHAKMCNLRGGRRQKKNWNMNI